jgi:hypothetical protein
VIHQFVFRAVFDKIGRVIFELRGKFVKSRGSSVSVETRLQAGRLEFDSRQELGFFFLLATASSPSLEPTQPPIQWVPRDLSTGVKLPERAADRTPPSATEVKNTWSYTSTHPLRFHRVVLRKGGVILNLYKQKSKLPATYIICCFPPPRSFCVRGSTVRFLKSVALK